MIFPTTFILSFFLTQIARAAPQTTFTGEAVFNNIYDKPYESLDDVACSELASKYPTFEDIPYFPYIGGAPYTTYNSGNCGAIWKIKANDKWIHFVGIDDAGGFDLSWAAFEKLGGDAGIGHVDVEAEIVGYIPK